MTATQLLAEICNRAGEGYQNYATRAGELFKAVVTAMINSGQLREKDAPGLLREGTITISEDGSELPLSAFLTDAGLDNGVFKRLVYSYVIEIGDEVNPPGTYTYEMEQITVNEHRVYALNPNIANSKDDIVFYKMTGYGTSAILVFVMPDAYESGSTIDYTMLGWTDTFITPVMDGDTDVSEVGTILSPIAFERAISAAAEMLVKEIMT
jgi:hypothetical protein